MAIAKNYHNPFWIAGFFLVLGWVAFGVGLETPVKHNFDEFHYIPAAKQFLSLESNRNWEHPPLGKYLIAVGIGLLGDQPTGWRVMSVLFGGITLALTFLLAFELFGSIRAAIQTALLTFFNHLLYVQSRIAMLDIFMLAWMWASLWLFLKAWKGQGQRYLAASGAAMGLAIACKWFAWVPWIALSGLLLAFQLLRYWKLRFPSPRPQDWWNPNHFGKIGVKAAILCWGVIPAFAYALTFVPFLFLNQSYSITDFWNIQATMWDGQHRVVGAHPYASSWLDWMWLKRPMWYAFDREPVNPSVVRGVFMVGNPLLMWAGMLALGVCAVRWVRARTLSAFFIVFLYTAFYGCWAVIPRVVHFYYYYLPAGMMLSFAMVEAWRSLPGRLQPWTPWLTIYACAVVFIFFFPILSGMPIPAETFRRWMWFSSWI